MPKDTLKNIPPEKRERVLRGAALFFAERGYDRTDMAALARRCGISKGSIYTYFDNKQELYMYVCRDGLERSREAVWAGVEPARDIYPLIEHVFRAGVAFAREYPEYVTLYLSYGGPGMEVFAEALSREVEQPTADTLERVLRDSIELGTVRLDLDVEHAAWLINNTYVMLLAALVSHHFRTRMAVYMRHRGELTDTFVERHLQRSIDTLHDMLRPRPGLEERP